MSNPFINNQPTFGYQGAQARLNARGSVPALGTQPLAYSPQQNYLNPLITTAPNTFQNSYDTSFMNPSLGQGNVMGSDPFAAMIDLLPGLLSLLVGEDTTSATTSATTMRTCHRQLRCAFAKEGVSCESGRGLGNDRATRAGMASGVRAAGTSTSTARTSKTIRCCGKSSNRDFEFLTLCFVSWRTR